MQTVREKLLREAKHAMRELEQEQKRVAMELREVEKIVNSLARGRERAALPHHGAPSGISTSRLETVYECLEGEKKPLTGKRISELTGLSSSPVSTALKRLLADGRVRRQTPMEPGKQKYRGKWVIAVREARLHPGNQKEAVNA